MVQMKMKMAVKKLAFAPLGLFFFFINPLIRITKPNNGILIRFASAISIILNNPQPATIITITDKIIATIAPKCSHLLWFFQFSLNLLILNAPQLFVYLWSDFTLPNKPTNCGFDQRIPHMPTFFYYVHDYWDHAQ